MSLPLVQSVSVQTPVLPFITLCKGVWRRQLNSNFNFQSGAPFSPLNNSDISGTLGGLASAIGIATRANVNTTLDVSNMSVEELFALRGVVSSTTGNALFRALQPGERIGNAGRNILRADGLNNVDFGLLKNTRIGENQRLQIRADFFNATNTRDFGTPNSVVTAPVSCGSGILMVVTDALSSASVTCFRSIMGLQ